MGWATTQCRKAPYRNVVVGPETGRSVGSEGWLKHQGAPPQPGGLNQAGSAVMSLPMRSTIRTTRYPLRPGSSSRRCVAPEEDIRAETGAVLVGRRVWEAECA